jgi:hypothetical protein
MARIIFTLTSELFDEPNQELSVQPHISVSELIGSAVDEFRLPPGDYNIYDRDTNRRLELDRSMEQLGIQTGMVLLFRREEQQPQYTRVIAVKGQMRMPFSFAPQSAFVREAETKTVFRLQWQPAVIGRPDSSNPDSNKLLAINLDAIPHGLSVSRNHASISEEEGIFYLEALSTRNPTFLNDQHLVVGEKYPLQNEDQIRVGKVTLIFHVPETQILPQIDEE